MIIVNKKESFLEKQHSIYKNKSLNYLKYFLIFVLIYYFLHFLFKSDTLLIFVLFIISIFIFKFFYKKINYLLDKRDNFKLGILGEQKALNFLKDLNDDYISFLNYEINQDGDIDILLISPKGIFAIEVKNWKGNFSISGNIIFKKYKNELYKVISKKEILNFKKRINFIKRNLITHKIYIPVFPVLIFDKDISKVEYFHTSNLYICYYQNLKNFVLNHKDIKNYKEIKQKILNIFLKEL